MNLTLKEQLAAKALEANIKAPTEQPKVEFKAEEYKVEEPKVEEAKKLEAKKEEKQEGPQFRKSTFAYQFKYSHGVIKADKMGVYTPQNAKEFEILKHAVKAGNILFN